ncbi:snaclec botrocetin subunit beta-like [Stigmatopora argus]
MAFGLRSFLLLCMFSGLLTGVWSVPKKIEKDNDCPKDWTRLDCHCYIYQTEERMFADAESVCNILGGNLVSIHTDLENAFVTELFKAGGDSGSGVWIGLHDAVENDNFLWTDGSEFDLRNFGTLGGDPDSSASGSCVELQSDDATWDIVDCTGESPYICITDVLTHSH